jgi:regulator of protease activity HflC (stomatin/prohibitin superfamily)
MAQIRRYPILRHLRAEPSSHVLYYRGGRLVASGRGLAIWFHPLSAAIAEVPVDDREQPFLFNARTRDFQEIIAQGTLSYRVSDPATLASRLDFSLDLELGLYQREPLDQLAALMTQLAQGFALTYLNATPLREALQDGLAEVRARIDDGLRSSSELTEMGLELVAVRVASLAPSAEMEKALQAPARESIQQQADQAAFERRALAVEKERAIAENELQNQIELAKREETLIEQRGQNERRRASEESETGRIEAEARSQQARIASAAQAEGIREVESARVESEGQRMAIYKELPNSVLFGLAARELAGKLQTIEHLNLASDSLTPLLSSLLSAGTRRLEAED